MKEIVSLFSGSFLAKFVGLATLPMIYIGFSIEELGRFDYILAGVALFEISLTLKLNEALIRFNSISNRAVSLSNLTIILQFYALIFSITLLILHLLGLDTFVFIVVISFFRSIFTCFVEFYRSIGDYKKYVVYINLFSIVNVISILLLILFSNNNNINYVFMVQVFIYGAISSYILLREKVKFQSVRIFRNQLYEFLTFSFPLVPSALSWWILRFINRYYLMERMGEKAVGQYAVINYIPQAIMISGTLVYAALQRFVYIHLDQKQGKTVKYVLVNLGGAYLCATLLVISLSKLLTVSVTELSENFLAYSLLVLASAFFVQASNFALILTHEKRTKSLAVSTVIASCVCWIFTASIQLNNLILYSTAFLMSTAIMLLIRLYLLRQFIAYDVSKYLFRGVFCLIIVFFNSGSTVFNIWDFLIVGVSVVLIMKQIIRIKNELTITSAVNQLEKK